MASPGVRPVYQRRSGGLRVFVALRWTVAIRGGCGEERAGGVCLSWPAAMPDLAPDGQGCPAAGERCELARQRRAGAG
jgi:hypothetical protein